ncbi:MAG TPA: DUF4331 domain-containing protein [Anaerolineae bacterium]|nr:DUF4331 domain-containing protein [Anaerolineae bacterium]
MRKLALLAGLLVAVIALTVFWQQNLPNAAASSHREAPLISQDPAADGTDFYMFVSPDKPDTVTFIANYYPFEDPAGGPNFYRFGDDVLYRINIDNNADAKPDIWYDFTFKTTTKNGNTFLYNTGPITSLDSPNLNVYQTYTVTRTDSSGSKVIGSDLRVPPNNIGPASTPNYEALAKAAVYNMNGTQIFAGQRDDPFFVDLGAIFDLLTIRPGAPGNHGGGNDDLAGTNVQTIALQVPISQLTVPPRTGIGGWTTAYRRATRVLDGKGGQTGSGDWVQVSRLDLPLVNEVVVPLAFKDYWNVSKPDGDAIFLEGVTKPELPKLLNLIYGLTVPAEPRNDLVTVFLTGIPGLNQPTGVVPAALLRLNTAIPPAKYDPEGGSPHFFGNRCGILAGDNAGFPNGRRLSDDVVDIALQVMAGGDPFTAATNVAPNNQLGDGTDQNDVPFLNEFPYAATPHNGFEHTHHLIQAPPGHGCAS